MQLERLGVWTFLDSYDAKQAAAFAKRVEDWGYGALWMPEAVGREPFSLHAHLASQTSRIVLATGIASIYARDAMAMKAVANTVGEICGGRFMLGIGVSHAPMVTMIRGGSYGKPLTTMRSYLEAMEKATYLGPKPAEPVPVLLAALGPKMLALAAESASGAHPYNVTPDHTARAREILGKDRLLCPEQKVMLETDASKARAAARQQLGMYFGLPNYVNNLKSLGFDDADFADGGSDRLIDAVVAWGDEDAIRKRVQEHWDAGADHVCIQPLPSDGSMGVDEKVLELLAPSQG
jgi:probable F420-dependent oxidoreductase